MGRAEWIDTMRGIINTLDEGKPRAILDGKNTSLFALRH
jgi:hypothetical protein